MRFPAAPKQPWGPRTLIQHLQVTGSVARVRTPKSSGQREESGLGQPIYQSPNVWNGCVVRRTVENTERCEVSMDDSLSVFTQCPYPTWETEVRLEYQELVVRFIVAEF